MLFIHELFESRLNRIVKVNKGENCAIIARRVLEQLAGKHLLASSGAMWKPNRD